MADQTELLLADACALGSVEIMRWMDGGWFVFINEEGPGETKCLAYTKRGSLSEGLSAAVEKAKKTAKDAI